MTRTPNRKVPLLPVLIGVCAGLLTGYGAAVYSMRSTQLEIQPTQTPAPAPLAGPDGGGDPAEYQERLMALGYSAGTETAPDRSGVTIHDSDRALPGYNVYASAHAPTAFLMTMDGDIVHRWAYSFHMLWPDVDPGDENVYYWRRVHLFENGDILAIIEPHGIFKLDKDSNLLWENRCGAHHDMYVAPNGRIFVLTREEKRLDLGGGERPVLEDFVAELTPDGREIRRVSILEALQQSPYASLIKDAPDHWDIFHTNAAKYIHEGFPTRVPAFQPGRFLLSLRELGAVAVLDMDLQTIEWALKGQWYQQHEPTLLESGNLMVFDNKGNHGRSKVIEIDPATQEIVWTYGVSEGQPLDSPLCGLAYRLPNGNTLITEAVPGRVIEVTPNHEIVWEYINPHRVEGNEEIIATFMDFQRLPQSFAPTWINAPAEHN